MRQGIIHRWLHPWFCRRGDLCRRDGPNLYHGEVAEVFVPRCDHTCPVTVGLVQLDEVDDDTGAQTVHPPEVALSVGDRTAVMSLADFDDLIALCRAKVEQARGDPQT